MNFHIIRGHLPLGDTSPGWMRIGTDIRGGDFQRVPVFPLSTVVDYSEVRTTHDHKGTAGESRVEFNGIANIDGEDVLVSGDYYRSGQRLGTLSIIGIELE